MLEVEASNSLITKEFNGPVIMWCIELGTVYENSTTYGYGFKFQLLHFQSSSCCCAWRSSGGWPRHLGLNHLCGKA